MANPLVRNRQLASDVARANQLVNGGFENWQRGSGPFTASGAFAADRWVINLVGSSTASVIPITSTVGSKGRSAQMTYTHAAAGSARIQNQHAAGDALETLLGKTITFSAQIKSSVAGTARLRISETGGPITFSSYNIGTGEETLSATVTIGSATTNIYFGVICDVASCVTEINDARVVLGSVSSDFVPLHPADDLARCLRYYEVCGIPGLGDVGISGFGPASGTLRNFPSFKILKVVTPTITKVGTWIVNNCGQLTISFSSLGGFMQSITISVANVDTYCVNQTAGNTITAEANP